MFQFLSVLILILFAGGPTMLSQNFATGEVLVKFLPGSVNSTKVEKAVQTTPPDLSVLNTVAESLQADVGLPLKVIRLAGGGWVLLEIDAKRVVERIVEHLRTRDQVRSINLTPAASSPLDRTTPSKSLLVEFATDRLESGSENPQQLVSTLASELDLPLTGSIREKSRLLIEIDWKGLTRILVDRLKALREIEAAQLNYILGIRPPS
jgi:hypothetical protein